MNISLIGPAKSLTNESDSHLTIDFEDLTHDTPPIPIRCKVLYELSGETELSNFGQKPNSCILRPSSLRAKSQKLKVYPTFDGVYLFPTHLEHIIEATPPKIFALSSFVSEDGLAVVVNFDKPVDLVAIERNITANTDADDDDDDNSFVMCDYLLKERTMEHLALHNLQSCRWATRIQLIITIQKPLSTDAIEVELNPATVLEFDQKYPLSNGEQTISANISKLSNSLNWWSYEPALAVVGPNQVAPCDQFILSGLFTSPRGTHEVDFSWEVSVEGEEETPAVSNELKHFVNRHGKSTNLILSADMVEVGLQYRFTFKAFVQARRQTLEAVHTLTKLEYPAPVITLYHTRLLHNLPHYESDNITLLADVRVPECVYPPQRLVPAWRVTDPKFHFPALTDMKRRFALDYTIDPYTVPSAHATSITLNAFIGLFVNQSSSATYTFETVKAPLKADLLGGINKMTIGSQSGLLRLTTGSGASEITKRKRQRVVYQWSCHDVKTAQPCYFNYASVPAVNNHQYNRNSLLLTPQMQHRSELFIESTSFLPNQQYLIGLQVFDANNSKVSSETEYTLLNVEAGAKPQVSIGPVLIKGKYVVPYNNRFNTFLIPFGTSIALRGQVYLQSGVKSVRWESTTFRYPLNWSMKRINEQQIDTELRIHDGKNSKI